MTTKMTTSTNHRLGPRRSVAIWGERPSTKRRERESAAWKGLAVSMLWQDVEHLLPFRSFGGDWHVQVRLADEILLGERADHLRRAIASSLPGLHHRERTN